MKSIYVIFFIMLISLFLSCSGEDDMHDNEVCNEIFDQGKFRLSDEVINFFPKDYLTMMNNITLFNIEGDSIELEYKGKTSSFIDRISERQCDEGINVYNYMLEYISVRFGNDLYDLNVRASLDLNIDFSNLNDSINILTVMDYDTCYSENFQVSLKENMPFNFNAIGRTFDSSSCIAGSNTLEPSIALDVFPAITLNGITFKDVLSNVDINGSTFIRMFYNQTYGFLGFEDSNEVLWAIKN